MPQSLESYLVEEKKKRISRNMLPEIDISFEEIEETSLIINGNEFPNLKKMISLNGKNKLEKVVLHNLPQLTELKLWNCQIKSIKIFNCPGLTCIDVRNNLLTDLNFLRKLEEKLIHLDVSDNDLKGWLPFLGNFKNLESLFIGNRANFFITKDCFQGSLEELEGLSKLGKIDISNTNVDSGLEHLPESTEEIGCSCYSFWPLRRKCYTIKEQLEDYLLKDYELKGEWYSVRKWRKSQPRTKSNNNDPLDNNYQHFQQSGSTSGNLDIDEFIKKSQLEWIPYEQLIVDPKPIGKGGFSKVYKANWVNKGPVRSWNNENFEHERGPRKIALKSLDNFQDIKADFLQEIANHKLFNSDSVVKCYGISKDPETSNYLMVMQYIEGGNLREHLKNNYNEINFKDKLNWLRDIAKGLNSIHGEGLIHKDFHLGNILIEKNNCYVADLGLSRPANKKSDKKICGVLPYVAPEILQGGDYTQASDIYSFGMTAYEIFNGSSFCYDESHDESLLAINGLRPQFWIKIPPLIEELVNRCCNEDFSKRPTADELSKILRNWCEEIEEKNDTKFYQQYKEIEKEYNKAVTSISTNVEQPKHTSQLLLIIEAAEYQSEPMQTDNQEQTSLQAQILQPTNLSHGALVPSQGGNK